MVYWGCLILFLMIVTQSSRAKKVQDDFIGVPITYYPGKSESLQPGDIECHVINECAGGMANYAHTQLVIDLPNNPYWDLQKGYVFAEISKCSDSFNSSCVLYTNYIWNDGLNIVAYSNITFTNNGASSLYLRFIGVQAPADFTFELTYGEYSDVYGVYDFDAFGNSLACSSYSDCSEFAKPSTVISVANFVTQYYQIQFCINNNFPNNNWSASINVVATVDKPKSAFEIFACSADKTVANCKVTHNDAENLAATSVVTLQITNTQSSPINNGIIIGVYGVGAEYDLINNGTLTVTVSNS